MSNHKGLGRFAALAGALLLLDVSLTFQNVWPTPAVRWTGDLSIELAACVLVMALTAGWFLPRARVLLRWVAAIWVVFVIGHYADVTTPALYGRDINLFWDLRYVPAVTAMLLRVASWWVVLAVVAAVVLIPILCYVPARWAFGRVKDAIESPRERRVLALIAAVAMVWFAGQRLDARWPAKPAFGRSVVETYGRQARLLMTELTGRGAKALGPAPDLRGDLARIAGADVLLIFIESYGAMSYDRPELDRALAASRTKLDEDIRSSGRGVVSAFVESPTFGGSSWLAHVSFLSGFEVRDEDTDALLMASQRETLVTTFARRGYRTLAIMPGLQQSWPEGAFYGFGDIYDERRLDYRGPQFGWWAIPDQYAFGRMDALLGPKPRRPAFVFLPTTSTHTPFSPTAPYQADWVRLLTDNPYDEPDLRNAWSALPDWLDLGPNYTRALSYVYESLGGYLRLRADRDFVMILIGDHQPPSIVSGEGATWEVPVHVIASHREVLDRLLASGFVSGLRPRHPALTRMHALGPIVLDAFSEQK